MNDPKGCFWKCQIWCLNNFKWYNWHRGMRLWYTQNNNNDNNNNNNKDDNDNNNNNSNNNNNNNNIIIIIIIIIVIKVIVVVMLIKRITIIIIITSILTWAALPASLLCFKVISISPAATINEHPALIGLLIIVKSFLAGPTRSFNWRKGT